MYISVDIFINHVLSFANSQKYFVYSLHYCHTTATYKTCNVGNNSISYYFVQGGMKAVVNTDVFQASLMLIGCVTVLIKVSYNAIRDSNK